MILSGGGEHEGDAGGGLSWGGGGTILLVGLEGIDVASMLKMRLGRERFNFVSEALRRGLIQTFICHGGQSDKWEESSWGRKGFLGVARHNRSFIVQTRKGGSVGQKIMGSERHLGHNEKRRILAWGRGFGEPLRGCGA